MMTVGRLLLPDRGRRRPGRRQVSSSTDYFTELTVLPDSPLVDKTGPRDRADGRPRGPRRHRLGCATGDRCARPSASSPCASGDVLMVRTSPEQIVAIREQSGVELHPLTQYGDETPTDADGQSSGGDDDEQVEDKPRPGDRRAQLRADRPHRSARSTSCIAMARSSSACGDGAAGSTRSWRRFACARATCSCCRATKRRSRAWATIAPF